MGTTTLPDPHGADATGRLGADLLRRLAALQASALDVARRGDGFAAAAALERLLSILGGLPPARRGAGTGRRVERLREAEGGVVEVAAELIRHVGRLAADIRLLGAAVTEAGACASGLGAVLEAGEERLRELDALAPALPPPGAVPAPLSDRVAAAHLGAVGRLDERLAELAAAREAASEIAASLALAIANAETMRATCQQAVEGPVAEWRRGLAAQAAVERASRAGRLRAGGGRAEAAVPSAPSRLLGGAMAVLGIGARGADEMDRATGALRGGLDEVRRIREEGLRLRAGRRAALEAAEAARVAALMPPPSAGGRRLP